MVYESCREGSVWSHSSFPVSAPLTPPYTTCLNCLRHAGADCPCSALGSHLLLPRQVPPSTGSLGHWVNALLGSAVLSPGHSPAPIPEFQAETKQPAQDGATLGRGSSAPSVRHSPSRAILRSHQVS